MTPLKQLLLDVQTSAWIDDELVDKLATALIENDHYDLFLKLAILQRLVNIEGSLDKIATEGLDVNSYEQNQ